MNCSKTFSFILPLLIAMACSDAKEKVRTEYIDADGNVMGSPNQTGQLNPSQCKTEFQTLCTDVQSKIEATQQEIDSLIKLGDGVSLYQAQLNLNELLEIRDSYQKGNADVTAIANRYEALRGILLASGDVKMMGSLTYQKEELAATREVFEALGELTIDPALIPANAGEKAKSTVFEVSKNSIPWAAFWYPKRGKEMFTDDNAPLQKLDRYLNSMNMPSQIANWEMDRFDERAAEWEGLCDSWAMAAISTIEPKSNQKIGDVEFTPSDLKALAIKYYEGYKPKIFGRRYQGLAATDGMIQDLRPEAFHRIVEEYIGKRKQPIVIDDDPGPEIWSKPMFRMSFTISKDPNRSHALLVKAFPWMTRQREFVDDAPTSIGKDLAAPSYEYRLYYAPEATANGRLRIIAGEWIGPSLNFHPDMVFLPQASTNQQQANPEMKKYQTEIRKLLEQVGMFKS